MVTNAGYPEYKYATGRHLGRLAHDGAGVLGPEWERYGQTPHYPLEAGHVYTVQPGLAVLFMAIPAWKRLYWLQQMTLDTWASLNVN